MSKKIKLEDIKNQVGINFYGNLATSYLESNLEFTGRKSLREYISEISELLLTIIYLVSSINLFTLIIFFLTPYFMFLFLHLLLPIGIFGFLGFVVVIILEEIGT